MTGDRDEDGKSSLEVESPPLQASTEKAPPTGVPAAQPPAGLVNVANKVRMFALIVGVVVSLGGFAARSRIFGKGLGAFVMKADECRSGKMLAAEGLMSVGGLCTSDCADDPGCAAGFRCYDGNCAPQGSKTIGQDCGAPWECQSMLCVSVTPMAPGLFGLGKTAAEYLQDAHGRDRNSRPACSQRCSDSQPCPEAFNCVNGGGDNQYCVKEELAPSLLDLLPGLRDQEARQRP